MPKIIKSPMNYIGNKYRILNQILPLFPECDRMVDLFAGGLDVAINCSAEQVYCNDINNYLIDIYRTFQKMDYNSVLSYLQARINEFKLSKTNFEGYNEFRNFYNHSERNPLDLYLLINYSFNYQLRFNSNHEFNNPFGKNRSSFNPSLQSRLKLFMKMIEHITFSSIDFRNFDFSILTAGDFVYCDPPYLISTGSYNDGKRGFNGWTKTDDIELMSLLDNLNENGIKFAMSNVIEHKNKKNEELLTWSKKYKSYEISSQYNNCNYHNGNKQNVTKEVLITNE